MRFSHGESEGEKYCIAMTNSFTEFIAFIVKSKQWAFHKTYWGYKYSFIKWRKKANEKI